ncbi:MAG TPA: glycosyltransferase family A protein [Candidatus Bathyarchaeia archaeon]|nr:glycosyltransferase family A protein [Candidatus Bathyarchaeia archaeon]
MRLQDIDLLTPTIRDFSLPAVNSHHWRLDSTSPLSLAREKLIQDSDTDWVLFVDDDITWSPETLDRMFLAIDAKTGAIDTQILDRGITPHFTTSRVTRGWLGFTLVRREAVQDWHPPPLQRFEDEHLRRHILKKGFRYKRILDIAPVIHDYVAGRPTKHDHFLDGQGARRVFSRREKIWMVAKTPLFLRRGKVRFLAHYYFVSGMIH